MNIFCTILLVISIRFTIPLKVTTIKIGIVLILN